MLITVESGHGMDPEDRGSPSWFWRRGQYDVAFTSLSTAVLGDAGVLVLTGDPGTGKTALLHTLAADVQARGVVVGRLLYPVLHDVDFLCGIAEAFGLRGEFLTATEFDDSFDHFAASVAAHGGRLLLIIDDALSLPKSSVREVRRLSRHRWDDGRARLSVILAGHEGLSAAVRTAKIEPTVAVQLHSLTPEDSAQFVAHLLRAAGGAESPLPAQAIEQICREGRGIPQVMTVLFNRAIAKTQLSETRQLLGEVKTARPVPRRRRSFAVPRGIAAGVTVGLLVMAGAGTAWYTRHGRGVTDDASGITASIPSIPAHTAASAARVDTSDTSIPRGISSPPVAQAEQPSQEIPPPGDPRPPTGAPSTPSPTALQPSGATAQAARAARVETDVETTRPTAKSGRPGRVPSGADAASEAGPGTPSASARTIETRARGVASHVERLATVAAPERHAEPRTARVRSEVIRPAAPSTGSSDEDDPGAIIDFVLHGR